MVMSKQSDYVKKWRKETKDRIIKAMGGACQCCSYNICNEALELHHINPSQKELSFGSIRANPISWIKIVGELNKCILVCSNCHREIHHNNRQLPNQYASFNPSFIEYKVDSRTPCLICGKLKSLHLKTCSHQCAAKVRIKGGWEKVDLKDLIHVKKLPWVKIAELVGVSNTSVKKRAKKLRII